LADAFIMLPLAVLFLLITRLQIRNSDETAITRHLEDFPDSFSLKEGGGKKLLTKTLKIP
ncbi:MAG: hypothetical protein M0Z75_08330, partial [Nitrospiraceae bacterium]|nr:hypothetical protein [Nitrospiraceae bacterium]